MNEILGVSQELMMFAEVVEAGGFSAASRQTGIPKSTLSRAITALEEKLGVALLVRSPRHFEITEIGQELLHSGQRMCHEVRSALATARQGDCELRGTVRVACPLALSAFLVTDVVTAFAQAHPAVNVTLHTTDGSIKPMHHDIIIQPARRRLHDSNMVAQRLAVARYLLVATPLVAKAFSLDADPSQLTEVATIGWTIDAAAAPTWTLYASGSRRVVVPIKPHFRSDNLLTIRKAALAGLGVAQLPCVLCQEDLEAGSLVQVLARWQPAPISIFALYASRQHLTPASRSLLAALAKAMAPIDCDP